MSNIVRAVFGGSKTTRTRRLWKIDRGMLLQFVDLNLPTAYQVHFANTPASGQAKVVTATSDTVEIPYEYLQTGADVYAWIYLTPENGVGYTEYMVTIPVYARPDTTDEEPVPAQQSALDTAISALNSGVESVQAAVAGVQDSINTALQEAKDSGEFDGADGYTPVKGVDYFDGDDGYSPSATVTQTENGATVTVTDKTGTTTAEISNGQDGATFTPAVSAEGVISWTNDGGKTNPQPVNIKGPQGDDYILTATDKEEIAQQAAVSLAPALDEKAPVIYCEASGAIASFTDGAYNLPVQDLVVQIEPVQAGSGDPSPENVRPITGWTSVKLTVSPTTDADDGQTYTISFGSAGTVYGGSLDVTTGVLTVDRAIHIVTAEELQLVGTTAKGIQYLQPKGGTLAGAKDNGQKSSNIYIESTMLNSGTWRVLNGRYYIYDNQFSDLETAKAIVTETEIQLVYELATPQAYQLTPTEVRTMLGQNNIWANTGDVSVAYRADTKKYVDDATPVKDVQVNGASVLTDGVANVPIAGTSTLGVVRKSWGVEIAENGALSLSWANSNHTKAGTDSTRVITPAKQNESTFYGLAKAAGDTTQSASSNEVGQYTDEAKLAIRSMLGAASESAVAAKYTKPSTGIPASDLASAVQTSLGKADTALQSAPVTSVNGSTGAVVLSIPSTAADVGAIAAPASPATGAFLVWSGNAWTAQTLATWEGGSF